MKPKWILSCIACALTCLVLDVGNAATVTVLSNTTQTGISTTTVFSESDTQTALNRLDTIDVMQPGHSSSTTLDWSSAGGYSVFKFDFDHSRSGARGAQSFTSQLGFYFQVDQDTTYMLSGLYELTGTDRLFSELWLRNEDSGTMLFRDLSVSNSTAHESFTLRFELLPSPR